LFERSYECICYLVLIVVSIDELDIDSIDGFEKGMCELHPKPEGEEHECYCGDVCKLEVSGDYKTCDNGSGCVIISHMILNWVIRRYRITDYVVKCHLKYLMSFEKY
jgi:hypothetical protein